MSTLFASPLGVLTLLSLVAALAFEVERRSGWRLFKWLPAYIWIYLIPLLLTNLGVTPARSPAYDVLDTYALPMLLTLLLIGLPLRAAVRSLGRGMVVMLAGSLGVVAGGVVSYLLVAPMLGAGAWKGFGALAGSWTGGTANMAATAEALKIDAAWYGVAVLADSLIFTLWLPFLLYTKRFTWAGGQDVVVTRSNSQEPDAPANHTDLLILVSVAFAVMWGSGQVARLIPEIPPFLTRSTVRILLITTISLWLSFTPLSRLRGKQSFAMALLYLFVASMGARADLSTVAQGAPWFFAAALLWIAIHGLFVFGAARLVRAGPATAAMGSAANIGGVASAVLVASHHDRSLVPAGILMAITGFALGNYMALITAHLCRMLG